MHFERQVICLKQSKKIVLFLVEGVTDETAFGLILSRLIEEKKIVRFKIIGGDITTRSGTNSKNCINRVVDQVKEFLARDFYQKSDILEIIHLVDLDGAFISEDHIIKDESKLPDGAHVYYTLDYIITDHKESICYRNLQKSEVLSKLSEAKEVYGRIPYGVYFFSCNLEHVFYDQQNVSDLSKYSLAKELVDSYVDEPVAFVKFLNSRDIAIEENYTSSWNKVKIEEESLKRHSNFHIYLNRCLEEEEVE